jgi:hypothetical protein
MVLERNPELELHHMHDPVQDRLMVRRMSYFRLKTLSLSETYRTLRTIPERYGLPAPLTLAELDQFLHTRAHRYDVDWIHDTQPLAA